MYIFTSNKILYTRWTKDFLAYPKGSSDYCNGLDVIKDINIT